MSLFFYQVRAQWESRRQCISLVHWIPSSVVEQSSTLFSQLSHLISFPSFISDIIKFTIVNIFLNAQLSIHFHWHFHFFSKKSFFFLKYFLQSIFFAKKKTTNFSHQLLKKIFKKKPFFLCAKSIFLFINNKMFFCGQIIKSELTWKVQLNSTLTYICKSLRSLS